jgi:dTDP-4-amino-4,6-dideoxygalactose transaminase
VIEDACHALGATYGGVPIGAKGDMAVFSFHPVKTITTGEGGAIVTNNKKFYERLLLLRSHGIQKDKKGFNIMTELGYNYRLPDFNAALGESQLTRLSQFVSSRRRVVSWYAESLKDVKGIILPLENDGAVSAWHIYVIRTKSLRHRLPLYRHLQQHGIGVNFHYPAVYSHPYYRKNGYAKTSLPVMEEYHHTAITIPLFPDLSRADVEYISKVIKAFFA